MSINHSFTQSRRFKTGWVILLVLAILMTLNHFVLIFALDEPDLFIGYTAFNLYAVLVIYFPLRQGQKWAWLSTWILPIGLAMPALLSDPNIAIFYYSVAAGCVLGLLLSMDALSHKGIS